MNKFIFDSFIMFFTNIFTRLDAVEKAVKITQTVNTTAKTAKVATDVVKTAKAANTISKIVK